MIESIETTSRASQAKPKVENDVQAAFGQLQKILLDYLEARPHLSLNGLAKRCAVSEPTLRRIRKGQLKTMPSVTTIIDLLVYISQDKDASQISTHFPGPIADYLNRVAPQINSMVKIEVSETLSQALKDPVKYLIYRHCANEKGITLDKVLDLFGSYGEKQLHALMTEGLVVEKEGRFHGTIDHFALNHDVFVEHFKATADFIKPHKLPNAPKNLSPLFINYSRGLNKKAYGEVLNIQRKALAKIRNVLYNPDNQGSIPAFLLTAIDTLDADGAYEIND